MASTHRRKDDQDEIDLEATSDGSDEEEESMDVDSER